MQKLSCLITGANAGIGYAAAVQLAQLGHRVILGCRNAERGQQALLQLRHDNPSAEVSVLALDLASQASIAQAADTLATTLPQLDVVIHNAADFDLARKDPVYTPEGIESVWATNHLGPVFLTSLLMPLLEKSPQGRILTVSSQGLLVYPGLKVSLTDPEFRQRRFSVEKAYYQSKLAQVMYTNWLAQKLTGTRLTCNGIRVTAVKIDLTRYPGLSPFLKWLYSFKTRFSITPAQMAETYVYLATSPEVAEVTGCHFDEKRRRVQFAAPSRDPVAIERLMALTFTFLKNFPQQGALP